MKTTHTSINERQSTSFVKERRADHYMCTRRDNSQLKTLFEWEFAGHGSKVQKRMPDPHS